MTKRSKRYKQILKLFQMDKSFSPKEAIPILKKSANTKFDNSVDIHFHLGVDPKKSDQMVRGTVILPHGTGKKVRIAVFAKGEQEKEAVDAGAEAGLAAGGD